MVLSPGHCGTLVCTALTVVALSARASSSGSPMPDDLAAILAQAGDRVEQFFTRAQSLVCTEIVSLQPLTSSFSPEGFPRTVESELRVSWEPGLGGPATEAQVQRELLRVNGRPPRENDPNNCTTPEHEEVATQPLSLLLPQQRPKYEFSLAGTSRVDGRHTTMIDFREVAPITAEVSTVEGRDDCISYDLTGGQRGRLWIDSETADVLRMDQGLVGMIDLRLPRKAARRPGSPLFITLERSDTTIRFGRVAFENPRETLVLPLTSTELRILRGGGAPRLRTSTKYSDYKRFLTGGRVVGDAR